jgi:predicted nuclease of predicted toxin-antitoxin system
VNIVADEDVERLIVARLRQDGHQVWYVSELSPGVQDSRVLALAVQQNALLLTADKDLGELAIRLQRPTLGIMLIRLEGLPTAKKAELVSLTFHQYGGQLPGALTVIVPHAVRIRKL